MVFEREIFERRSPYAVASSIRLGHDDKRGIGFEVEGFDGVDYK
jgi:hypothetical protein